MTDAQTNGQMDRRIELPIVDSIPGRGRVKSLLLIFTNKPIWFLSQFTICSSATSDALLTMLSFFQLLRQSGNPWISFSMRATSGKEGNTFKLTVMWLLDSYLRFICSVFIAELSPVYCCLLLCYVSRLIPNCLWKQPTQPVSHKWPNENMTKPGILSLMMF